MFSYCLLSKMDLEQDLSRDLDNQPENSIDELADDYFSSVSSISRNIIRYKHRKLQDFDKDWNSLSQSDKDKVLNEWFLDDGIRLRYEIRLQGTEPPGFIPESYPKLKVQCGTKTVQYTDSDQNNQVITWRDEFSGPFSWDTKCQQNLGLFGTAVDVSSVQDDCESSMNSSTVSADLSSSELFSRVKDISNRLSSGEINIHVNPTFNMDQKLTANSFSRPEVDTENKGKVTPVVSQPKAAPKLNGHQTNKSISGRHDSQNTSVSKPSQPPPVAPGVAKKAHPPSGGAFQLSASSNPTSSSTAAARPLQRPPSVPPPAVSKPSQPPHSSPTPVAVKPLQQPPPGIPSSGRPSETPPPPPPTDRNLRNQSSPKSPKRQTPQTSLLKSNDRGDEKILLSSGIDQMDISVDLDHQQPSSGGDVQQEKEEEEQVDTHSGAAFDFLLQW
ncbi:hypothetical protein HOLleu_08154 [Holothuria leucospilota]|uniref:DUF4706 domain-containing protein n=1 Tax=Holothuria leucospilota TaxID=206669 RepID=A0A9Q1CIA3_HOLLE|nr:hypothetical protein HOLleu_08154 [Holothuria leucospilota]